MARHVIALKGGEELLDRAYAQLLRAASTVLTASAYAGDGAPERAGKLAERAARQIKHAYNLLADATGPRPGVRDSRRYPRNGAR